MLINNDAYQRETLSGRPHLTTLNSNNFHILMPMLLLDYFKFCIAQSSLFFVHFLYTYICVLTVSINHGNIETVLAPQNFTNYYSFLDYIIK